MRQFGLRLPDEMHKQLAAWAKEDGRSLHGLLLWIVMRALRERSMNRAA